MVWPRSVSYFRWITLRIRSLLEAFSILFGGLLIGVAQYAAEYGDVMEL